MKTNDEAKQEIIKQKWEEAGFIWSEIEHLVNSDGILKTKNPDGLEKITGYLEALIGCRLKWLGGWPEDGYLIELTSIEDINKNNGWTRIEPNGTNLPDTTQDLVFTKRTDGRQEKTWYNGQKKYFARNYTHFRGVPLIPPPIY